MRSVIMVLQILTREDTKSQYDGVILSDWMFVQERMDNGGVVTTHKGYGLQVCSEGRLKIRIREH